MVRKHHAELTVFRFSELLLENIVILSENRLVESNTGFIKTLFYEVR